MITIEIAASAIGIHTAVIMIPSMALALCTAPLSLNPYTASSHSGIAPPMVKPILKKSPIMALIMAALRLPDFNSPYAMTSGTSAHIKPVAEVKPHCLIKVAI